MTGKYISDGTLRATADKFATDKRRALLAYDRIHAGLIKAGYEMTEGKDMCLLMALEGIQARATGIHGSNSLDRRYHSVEGRAAIRAELAAKV